MMVERYPFHFLPSPSVPVLEPVPLHQFAGNAFVFQFLVFLLPVEKPGILLVKLHVLRNIHTLRRCLDILFFFRHRNHFRVVPNPGYRSAGKQKIHNNVIGYRIEIIAVDGIDQAPLEDIRHTPAYRVLVLVLPPYIRNRFVVVKGGTQGFDIGVKDIVHMPAALFKHLLDMAVFAFHMGGVLFPVLEPGMGQVIFLKKIFGCYAFLVVLVYIFRPLQGCALDGFTGIYIRHLRSP